MVVAAWCGLLLAPGRLTAQVPACAEASAAARCIAVAARPLARGATLTAEDITFVPAGEAARSDTAVAPGWIARRVIRAGEPLRRPAVVPPRAVRPGQPVDVTVVAGAVRITVAGKAVDGGSPGDTVTVRLDSSRRLTGVITATGAVAVTIPRRQP